METMLMESGRVYLTRATEFYSLEIVGGDMSVEGRLRLTQFACTFEQARQLFNTGNEPHVLNTHTIPWHSHEEFRTIVSDLKRRGLTVMTVE